ncbi:MAG TPA: NAD(P)/FAD-dependent oxidoreductase [Anaerolineales bacterium]|nr:NAD(P)/FAD-dependent oxidoreductase [Anaerolineales bacterium]
MSLKLKDGDRVCIIGGGPAGSFAAIHLLRLARLRGIQLEVLIFEPRDFNTPGPGGCNRCAGILSSRLLGALDRLGIGLLEAVVQADLYAYAAHLDGGVLRIERPDPARRIVSVYRGGGPRLNRGEPQASFDGFLLSQACAHGAQHVPARVRKVEWNSRPVVFTARERFPADFLVLATGVNSRAPMAREFGYRPPKTEIMAQDEMLRPPDWSKDTVSAFFRDPPGLVFGALIPKGDYLNLSLLGKGLNVDTISNFIEAQGLDPNFFSPLNSLCGCNPRIAVGPAGHFFGRRWVAVGDAAVTRLYKDGIGSAFFTARSAMQVAVERGVSWRDFARHYAPFCQHVARDNLYGRLLFRMWNYTLRIPSLLRAWTDAVTQEAGRPPGQRLHTRVLWGMFTGDEPYRDLFWISVSPGSLRGIWSSWEKNRA